MGNSYRTNLIQRVMDLSHSESWDSAVLEWAIVDCDEDEELQSSCICGKEELRYLFTIRNIITGHTLFPIGSSCIKKFEREDLDEQTAIQEKLFKLFHAIEDGTFITLSPDFFSRKVLQYLFEEDAFEANEYNNFTPEVDYEFMLKMFNKRDKSTITFAQRKKVNAIIMNSIRPYLSRQLANKIR